MISLVVPVYNDAENIQAFVRDVESTANEHNEIIIAYDSP